MSSDCVWESTNSFLLRHLCVGPLSFLAAAPLCTFSRSASFIHLLPIFVAPTPCNLRWPGGSRLYVGAPSLWHLLWLQFPSFRISLTHAPQCTDYQRIICTISRTVRKILRFSNIYSKRTKHGQLNFTFAHTLLRFRTILPKTPVLIKMVPREWNK